MCNNLKNATKTLSTKFVPYLRKVIIMMNKQVIINNIDVSECEHLTETRHCKAQMAVMGTDANRCKCFPNCHYKQLVREKQECEKLKKQYNCYACDTCNGKEDYIHLKEHCENAIKSLHNKQVELNQLKADNKQLKEELSKVYEDIKLSPLCYKCDEEECLQKEIDKLKADNEMLRDELRFYKDFYYACN